MGGDCAACGPNRRWVCGRTEIRVCGGGKCRLSLVTDSYLQWLWPAAAIELALRARGRPAAICRASLHTDSVAAARLRRLGFWAPAASINHSQAGRDHRLEQAISDRPSVTRRKGLSSQLDNEVSLA